jgi:hypothetical protein
MRSGLGIRNTTLLRTRLHLLLKQRLMHRLRRSRPRLGQPLLLQRRRAGRNGHAQKISCSSSFAVAEEEVEKKGCKRRWPTSPSPCSCFYASRCHYSSLSLRGRETLEMMWRLSVVSTLVRAFFFFLVSFCEWGSLMCRNMYGRSFVFP